MTRLKRVPPLHMPRLDWRLWLLAQGRGDNQRPGPPLSSWYGSLLERLVEGSPDVLALLEPPPPGQVHGPWLEVRGRVYAYRLGRGGGEARWVRWPRGEKDPTADTAVPVTRTESNKKSN